MSKFFDKDAKPEKGELEPHPSALDNLAWCLKMLAKVNWLPPESERINGALPYVRYEIHNSKRGNIFDHGTREYVHTHSYPDPTCIIFTWESKGKEYTHSVSFHANPRNDGKTKGFKEGLCEALNQLGSMGFLTHKEKNNDGTPRNKSSAPLFVDGHARLFGRH